MVLALPSGSAAMNIGMRVESESSLWWSIISITSAVSMPSMLCAGSLWSTMITWFDGMSRKQRLVTKPLNSPFSITARPLVCELAKMALPSVNRSSMSMSSVAISIMLLIGSARRSLLMASAVPREVLRTGPSYSARSSSGSSPSAVMIMAGMCFDAAYSMCSLRAPVTTMQSGYFPTNSQNDSKVAAPTRIFPLMRSLLPLWMSSPGITFRMLSTVRS